MSSRPGRPRRGKRSFRSYLRLVLIALLCVEAVIGLWFLKEAEFPALESTASVQAVSQPETVHEADGGDGLEVYFLDVGQGDSQLVRLPQEGGDGWFDILIDTGEYAYADGLTEYLRDLGVEKLDYFLISHPHTDHMGCAARIIQRFDIGRFGMPRVTEEAAPVTSAYEALLDALNDKGIVADALDQNAALEMPEGLSLKVLAPREDADWDDLNNWSAVFRLTYGETSFLFTGDAEKQSESLILEDAEARGWDLKTDVLKCGHHGSRTSSSAKFLKAVDPEYAVISCAMGNDYGHPHQQVLEKLEKLDVDVYRTDLDGTVLAKSDGKTVSWQLGLSSVEAREWD